MKLPFVLSTTAFNILDGIGSFEFGRASEGGRYLQVVDLKIVIVYLF
jgi:hypothetical protein